jgi:hypothetical protein
VPSPILLRFPLLQSLLFVFTSAHTVLLLLVAQSAAFVIDSIDADVDAVDHSTRHRMNQNQLSVIVCISSFAMACSSAQLQLNGAVSKELLHDCLSSCTRCVVTVLKGPCDP